MNKKAKISLAIFSAVLIVVALFLVNSNAPAQGDPIKIGFVGPLSGDGATFGEAFRNAVALAIDEVNQDGGVDGRSLTVVYEDGECSGSRATSATRKLINVDGVQVIIGGMCSGEALAMIPLLSENEIVAISPAASSPDLTGASEFFFRNNPSDVAGGRILAEAILRRGNQRVAVISEQTDYAVAFEEVLVSVLRAGGAQVVAQESYAPETNDFRTQLSKVRAADPDVLVINPQTEISGGNVLRQARELGIAVPVYGSIIMSGSTVIDIAGAAAESTVVLAAPGLGAQDNARAFLSAYSERFGDPTFEFHLGAAYDAVHIIRNALEKAGNGGAEVRRYLDNMESYDGVIGTYAFDKNGDLAGISHELKQIKDGELVPVK